MDALWYLVIALVCLNVVMAAINLGRAMRRSVEVVRLRREVAEYRSSFQEMSYRWARRAEQVVRVREALHKVESEKPAVAAPAVSVQLGRWQVADEIRAALRVEDEGRDK